MCGKDLKGPLFSAQKQDCREKKEEGGRGLNISPIDICKVSAITDLEFLIYGHICAPNGIPVME
jgi:hypothetical protein